MKHSPFSEKIPNVINSICSKIEKRDNILEIGCGPSEKTLLHLDALKNSKNKIGINLREIDSYKEFKVKKCNSNNMSNTFKDNYFDVVISHAILEHDKYFWKSLDEIYRILKPNGYFILGVPALISNHKNVKFITKQQVNKVNNHNILNGTITYKVHNAPEDYWRFTEQAYKEVLMENFYDINYEIYLVPPIILGYGRKNG